MAEQQQEIPEEIRRVQQRINQLEWYSSIALGIPFLAIRLGFQSLDSGIKAASSDASNDYLAASGTFFGTVVTGFIWANLPIKQWHEELGLLRTRLIFLQRENQEQQQLGLQIEGQGEAEAEQLEIKEEGRAGSPSPRSTPGPTHSLRFGFSRPDFKSPSELEMPLLRKEGEEQDEAAQALLH
ncbi:MAG TPA: hypothetical protein VHE99_00540 [Gammaproteobacteria bacterium]|nr:hypothetical protein [Gammaproteobacteria bacterium]